jgi:hypothetical protein
VLIAWFAVNGVLMNRWQFPDPEPTVKNPDILKLSQKDEFVEEQPFFETSSSLGEIKEIIQHTEEVCDRNSHAKDLILEGAEKESSCEYILSGQAMVERLVVSEVPLIRPKNVNAVNYFSLWLFVWIGVGILVLFFWTNAFHYAAEAVPGAPIGHGFGLQVNFSYLYLSGFCVALWLYLMSVLGRFLSLNASFPSAISLGKESFFFSWFGEQSYSCSVIPWNAVKNIAVRRLQLQKRALANACEGAMVIIDVDLRDVDNCLQILRQTAGVSDYCCPGISGFWERRTEWVKLHLPLAALSRQTDGRKFLLDLRARLPENAQSREFLELVESISSESFTRLWLDEVLSHRRDNSMELVKRQSLQGGRYIIEERIAIGGQATIYKALFRGNTASQVDARVVAIKEFVLPNGGTSSTMGRSLDSIKKEALLLAFLEHPAIPNLLDNFVEDQRAYLCFEYIDGLSLRSLVQDRGCLPPEQVIDIARKMADILVYLHGCAPPVVHRDLSPDNLMLSSDGRLSLIDFNVAEQLESNDTKTVVGKQRYMAPEQFKGRPCPQSDLYSMGGCLNFLLKGKDPRPLSLSTVLSDDSNVDDKDLLFLHQLIAKLTQLSLLERYQSIVDVQRDLSLPC